MPITVPSASALQPARSSTLAIALTWFLPGAGHIYVGRMAFGFATLVGVSALYYLGLRLSHGMTFEYLDLELRSPFATLLTPESGNLSALLYQMKQYGFGPEPYSPRVWPEYIRLGSFLCAFAGLLNACLAAHAGFAARASSDALVATRSRLPPAAQALAAWALPGLGHWLQGRKLRALLVAGLLIGLLVGGSLLAEYSNLSRQRHFYYWSGQFLSGLPAALLELWKGDMQVEHEIRWADAGLLFGALAGLLNVLAMLDVYAWGEAVSFGDNPLEPRGEQAKRVSGPDSAPATNAKAGASPAPVVAPGPHAGEAT